MTDFNRVSVLIYEVDEGGAIKPNSLFHRSFDKLHSRCIEYPFAASRVKNARSLLDVGTAKADPAWISWLENLPLDVHATDYDAPRTPFENITFHQGDVRHLPIADNTFDQVLAVSVVEHIGLESPQVDAPVRPTVDSAGDVEAVRELIRVLKPGGELIMTFPFGLTENTLPNQTARWYTADSLRKFEAVAQPVLLEYYEYQYAHSPQLFVEFPRPRQQISYFQRLKQSVRRRIGIAPMPTNSVKSAGRSPLSFSDSSPGAVTWRRIPMDETKATQHRHIDGVICGVWRKL